MESDDNPSPVSAGPIIPVRNSEQNSAGKFGLRLHQLELTSNMSVSKAGEQTIEETKSPKKSGFDTSRTSFDDSPLRIKADKKAAEDVSPTVVED